MATRFIPAKYTKKALQMIPAAGLGFDLEALPQLAPARTDPVQRVPMTSDSVVRVDPSMPVLSSGQPEASSPGRTFQLPNTKGVFSMSNQNPIMCGRPIGGLGSITSGLQVNRGLTFAPSKTLANQMTYAPSTLNLSARDLQVMDMSSPWVKYTIYGVAGAAVLGLGYLLLGK